jgi:hypothetical protein
MNRDLLVLTKQEFLTEEQAALIVASLNNILGPVENWSAFCVANEIIDINKRKIVTKTHLVKQLLQDKPNKAFIFICNKN